MRLIKNIVAISIILTLFGCSRLLKSSKTTPIPTESIVKIKTEFGDMYVELSDSTPLHKANFLKLAEEGFYDSTLFHRVISGFMVQGGDPESKGAPADKRLGNGGPGYTIPAEFDTSLFHKKGAIAAARLGDGQNPKKASSGSQFYLVQGKVYTTQELKGMERQLKSKNPNFKFTKSQIKAYTTIGGTPFLDANYTVYGQVIKGIEVIDKIAQVQTSGRRGGNRPLQNVSMTVEVIQMTKEEKDTLLGVVKK